MIGRLFAGKAQFPEESGWEPFSMAEEPEDYCAAEWADIITRAEQKGIKVKFTEEGLVMKYGRDEGLFKDYKGGVKLAQRFLNSL